VCKEKFMWDLIFIVLTVVLFGASIWYTRACDKV
jgi:hypothetical protein